MFLIWMQKALKVFRDLQTETGSSLTLYWFLIRVTLTILCSNDFVI